MGGDGGSIPGRQDLVRTKGRGEQKDKDAERAARWKCCAISQQALVKPIMACELGRLYNKDSILEFLIDRSQFPMADEFQHIRNLKDVKELNLTPNPSFKALKDRKGDAFVYGDKHEAAYICPVTGLEMNGKYKFFFLFHCGCAMTERSIKEVHTDQCHKCGGAFDKQDVVLLNGTEEETEQNRARMDERRAKAKAEKKAKKRQKEDSAISSDTAKQAKKVEFKAPKSVSVNKEAKSAKPKVTIQEDPNSSKVFKSLFTTSKAAKEQKKGHWVTHSPYM